MKRNTEGLLTLLGRHHLSLARSIDQILTRQICSAQFSNLMVPACGRGASILVDLTSVHVVS
jgi:hypothetical protein